VSVEIKENYPPTVTQIISSVHTYKGKKETAIQIPDDLFYDAEDTLFIRSGY
jgi:hypothetical protein